MSLRTKVLRGGVYLVLRQALGVFIGAVGLILLTRALGPETYGLWAAAIGVYLYFYTVGGWGVDVYLIRQVREPSPQDYHQAFSLLLLVGLAGAGLGFLGLPFLESWVRLEGFGPVAIALFVGLPVHLLTRVPMARLERALDYRKVALIELSGLVIFYPVALPLAYQGLGPWAPVAGWWAGQLLTLMLVYRMSSYKPRLYWEWSRLRAMMKYSLGYSFSIWIWNLGNLVNPLVVGRYAGADAVGQVALALRLVEQFGSIIVFASERLSVPVFARLQEDRARLVNALNKGMSLQLMALGPILVGVGSIAPWVLPILLGPDWLPALEVYPFVALYFLTATAFILHSSVLFVLRRIWEVALVRLVDVSLLAGSALLLVPHLGLKGFGWASVLALPSWILLLIWFRAYVGRPISTQAMLWFIGWAIPLFGWQLGPWAWTSVLVPLIWPATRRELLQAIAAVWRRVY